VTLSCTSIRTSHSIIIKNTTQPWQCYQLKYIVHLILSRKEGQRSIGTSHSIIINKGQYILVSDTIMAVFLLSIILCVVPIDRGCSFLLKVRWTIYFSWWRCYGCVLKEGQRSIGTSHSIIINKTTAMIVSLTKMYCPSDIKKKRTHTVYQMWRSDRRGCSFLLKFRWTIYLS
jgi:hypothetical protein